MAIHVHTAVIGGGPAGMACAIALQRKKIPNCVIDRAVFPRNKACAGLVTKKTYKLVRRLLSKHSERIPEMFVKRISEVAIFDRDKLAARARTDGCFHLAYRKDFDYSLVRAYQSDGGMMFEGQQKYSIDYENNRILLKDGTIVNYKYLVFADGALSQAHKAFHIKPTDLSFSVETFIPARDIQATALQIHFGYILPGYVWVFPYGDRVGAGICTSADRAGECVAVLKDFLKDLGADSTAYQYRGAYIPFGRMADQSMTPENVLLIGDAGGFVDPIYAEGLYMALYTGMQAAKAMSSTMPKQAFLKGVRPLCRMVRSGIRLQKILYSKKGNRLFREKIYGRDRFLKYYCDKQVLSYRYDHMDPRLFINYKLRRDV